MVTPFGRKRTLCLAAVRQKTTTSITGSTFSGSCSRKLPGQTYTRRSAPVPAAAQPHRLRKPRVHPRIKLPPAHVEPASDRAEVPIPHAGQNGWICYLRRVARVHGHVRGGKRQGLEAGWLYVEGQMGWLRATSCRAPHRAISFWRNTNLSPSISCARGDREEVCGDLDVLKQLAWVGGGHSGSCP